MINPVRAIVFASSVDRVFSHLLNALDRISFLSITRLTSALSTGAFCRRNSIDLNSGEDSRASAAFILLVFPDINAADITPEAPAPKRPNELVIPSQ